ncbi:hypothetical protein PENTCL1PPCAC_8135, partial [Pristionchus entomophagus]
CSWGKTDNIGVSCVKISSKYEPGAAKHEWWNLHVANVPATAEYNKMHQAFSKYGTVVDCSFAKDRGYGFVSYSTREAADRAIKETNKILIIDGKTVRVGWANSSVLKGGRPARYNNGSEK